MEYLYLETEIKIYMDIKNIIENEFHLTVDSISILGQGLDSIAYLVNNEYIFKMSKHEEAKENLKKEIKVLNYLKGKITLQIPTIEFYSEKYSICGYKEIKGDKLTTTIYNNMSNEEQDKLAQDLAIFLKELHSLPLPNIDDLELDVIDDYANDYEMIKEFIYNKIPEKSKIYLDKLYERILNDARITKYDKVLCHNDLSCNHIIIQNNQIVGIIDFGDVAITDRDKDFIYLLENSKEEIGRKFGLKVLNYYNHPNKDIPLLKSKINDEYYPIELILGGKIKGINKLYEEGLKKIKNI